MEFKCKECGARNEYDEEKYPAGSTIELPCKRCGTFNEVEIPLSKENSEEKPEISSEIEVIDEYSNLNEDNEQESTEEIAPPPIPSQSVEEVVVPVRNIRDNSVPTNKPTPQKRGGGAWLIVGVLLLLICGVGGWWYYDNIYLPEKIDREAPRSYPIVNVNLRSSKMAGSDYNKLTSVPYGGELITYNMDDEWAEVKYVMPDGTKSKKGYVSSPYLLSKKDLYILNSMFGDRESREILETAKVRRALLDYYKEKGYIGKLASELMQEIGVSADSSSQWQVFFPHGANKPNEVVFKRLINPNSKFTDMALIIKNINTGNRKLLYFYFDDDETPHLAGEMDAPREGVLKDVIIENGIITPVFTNL